jgi:hypothetical protein
MVTTYFVTNGIGTVASTNADAGCPLRQNRQSLRAAKALHSA